MKRLLTIPVLLIFIYRYCPAQTRKSNFMGLKGEVKAIHEYIYLVDDIDSEYIPSDTLTRREYKFDPYGNLIHLVQYDKTGKKSIDQEMEYDGNEMTSSVNTDRIGNMIITKIRYRNDTTEFFEEYNPEGNLTGTLECIFDDKSMTEITVKKEASGTQAYKTIRKFDDNYNVIEEISYMSENDLNPVIKKRIIGACNLSIEEKFTMKDGSGNEDSVSVYYEYLEFDEKGNWTRSIQRTTGLIYSTVRDIEY